MSDNPRLHDAVARNRGRQILPLWMDKFRGITGHNIECTDFIDTSRTRQMKEAFFERVKAQTGCCAREWHARDFSEVLSLLKEMSYCVGSVEVVLFSDVDSYIGALRVQSTLVLTYADKLMDLVKEDLCFASEDMSLGMCIEFNYHSEGGEYSRDGFYRLVTWGDFCHMLHCL